MLNISTRTSIVRRARSFPSGSVNPFSNNFFKDREKFENYEFVSRSHAKVRRLVRPLLLCAVGQHFASYRNFVIDDVLIYGVLYILAFLNILSARIYLEYY
jgi:hypothetical protein